MPIWSIKSLHGVLGWGEIQMSDGVVESMAEG